MIKIVLGAAIGGAAGFAVYKFIGCRGGVCPITGNPLISVIYFAIIGAIIMGQR